VKIGHNIAAIDNIRQRIEGNLFAVIQCEAFRPNSLLESGFCRIRLRRFGGKSQ
jgi:hypothetical protein